MFVLTSFDWGCLCYASWWVHYGEKTDTGQVPNMSLLSPGHHLPPKLLSELLGSHHCPRHASFTAYPQSLKFYVCKGFPLQKRVLLTVLQTLRRCLEMKSFPSSKRAWHSVRMLKSRRNKGRYILKGGEMSWKGQNLEMSTKRLLSFSAAYDWHYTVTSRVSIPSDGTWKDEKETRASHITGALCTWWVLLGIQWLLEDLGIISQWLFSWLLIFILPGFCPSFQIILSNLKCILECVSVTSLLHLLLQFDCPRFSYREHSIF